MSLLFMDSFDKYTVGANPQTQMQRFWGALTTGSAIESGLSPNGTNNFEITAAGQAFSLAFAPNSAEGWIGFRFRADGTAANNFLGIRNGGTAQLTLDINGSGELRIRRGGSTGTILGTTSGVNFTAGRWYYIEFRWLISDTVGEAELHLDGTTFLNLSGIDTNFGGAEAWDHFVLEGFGSSVDTHWDDLYLLDDVDSGVTGAPNNDFLGDVFIEAIFPDGAGATTQLTPSAGSNFQNVGDTADKPGPDDDATFNSSNVASDQDTYQAENLSVIVVDDIRAVQVSAVARTESGNRDARLILRDGGVDRYGAAYTLATVYGGHTNIAQGDDPFAGAAQWTIANVNALEPGFEVNT